MATKKKPWTVRLSDFSESGIHAGPTVGYELFFRYLRVSPSYDIAHKMRTENLKTWHRQALPSDFDEVLKTYDLLGDVQQILFRDWWHKCGLKVFGRPYDKPEVKLLAKLEAGTTIDPFRMIPSFSRYLRRDREEMGNHPAIVVALPMNILRSDLLRQLRPLLDELPTDEDPLPQPILQLMGERLRTSVLLTGLLLLNLRAAHPERPYWRLGAGAKLSVTYSYPLDPNAPRSAQDAIERYDRVMLTKLAYRAVRKAEKVAENAARGRFPCELPVEQMDFAYPELAQRIQECDEWESAEYRRKMDERRQQRNSSPPKTVRSWSLDDQGKKG